MKSKVRLTITLVAKREYADEVANQLGSRCIEVRAEPGCLQFEIFRSVTNPNNFTLLELWSSQSALDDHAEANKQRAPLATEMFAAMSQREDYEYNRTR